MPEPNDSSLPQGVALHRLTDDAINLSNELVALLVGARNEYEWPSGKGRVESQKTIIELEEDVSALINEANIESAHIVFQRVSEWAGNNAKAHIAIVEASADTKMKMQNCLRLLSNPASQNLGMDRLAEIPGVNLVIASKIFRFCCPQTAAAVDRHASYFFNSLDFFSHEMLPGKATHFRREWSDGKHATSRLATFTPGYFKVNRNEYFDVYLPLLHNIAAKLNSLQEFYECAVTGQLKNWRPTDVEMAAYYWWARNGAR